MQLDELFDAVSAMVLDATKNGQQASEVEVQTITERGTVKPLKGYRPFDVRTGGPALLTK